MYEGRGARGICRAPPPPARTDGGPRRSDNDLYRPIYTTDMNLANTLSVVHDPGGPCGDLPLPRVRLNFQGVIRWSPLRAAGGRFSRFLVFGSGNGRGAVSDARPGGATALSPRP